MPLLTRAEATGYTETSRHADVMAFLDGLSARGDRRLHRSSFGRSPQGRELPLLVLSGQGVQTPQQARAAGLPVVLVINGIHPGEVEGKEAAMMLVRDLLGGPEGDLLDHLCLVVMPLFNPDGNDAIDPGNRRLHLPKLSGQLGPDSGVGTRVTSQGINLNRDYMRQQAPEMRAFTAGVWGPWAPDLTLDNHATNGSVHRFSMTVDIPHTVDSGPRAPIEHMRQVMVPALIQAVRDHHGIESGWYGNFVEDERALDARIDADPQARVGEGWMTYPHHPRFGGNYRGLWGGLDLLLECYSYISFEERVRTATAWMLESLRHVAAHGPALRDLVAAHRRPPDRVAVRYALAALPEPVQVLTRSPRTLDGAPTSVHLPHLARFVGTTLIDRPRAYLVPPGLAALLSRHGLQVEPAQGTVQVQVATVQTVGTEDGRAILEAAATGEVEVSWARTTRTVPPGWSRVSTDQPGGAVAVYLCEPESDDGAVENGALPAPAVGQEWGAWREG